MNELKPCPFCGGEARLLLNAKRKIYGKDEYKTGAVACCNVCEARMFYGSEKLAIEAWNRREGDAPTIEPQRKMGKWIGEERQRLIDETDDGCVYMTDTWWYCSECGNPKGYVGHKPEDKYCNECGAKMEV